MDCKDAMHGEKQVVYTGNLCLLLTALGKLLYVASPAESVSNYTLILDAHGLWCPNNKMFWGDTCRIGCELHDRCF